MRAYNILPIFILISLLIFFPLINAQEPDAYACNFDAECVAESCCHPNSCINQNFAVDCSGVICTMECRPGSLDCGQGSCQCINSRCQAVLFGAVTDPSRSGNITVDIPEGSVDNPEEEPVSEIPTPDSPQEIPAEEDYEYEPPQYERPPVQTVTPITREINTGREPGKSCDFLSLTANSFFYDETDDIYLELSCNNQGYFKGKALIYLVNEDYLPLAYNDAVDFGFVVASITDFSDTIITVRPSDFRSGFQYSGIYSSLICYEDCTTRRNSGPMFKFYKHDDCPEGCYCDDVSFYCGVGEEFCSEDECMKGPKTCSCVMDIDKELAARESLNQKVGSPKDLIYTDRKQILEKAVVYTKPIGEDWESEASDEESSSPAIIAQPVKRAIERTQADLVRCVGCLLGNKCVPYGTRTGDQFCSLDEQWVSLAETGQPCNNNYECKSNFCSNQQCYDIKKELEETRNIIEKILDWLTKLFGS